VLERSTTTDGKKDGILYVSKYQLLKSAETGLKSILERDKRVGKSYMYGGNYACTSQHLQLI
jgi:hypothetical protein